MKQAFVPRFRELVDRILRSAPRIRGGRVVEGRARRQVLSMSGTFAGHRPYTSGEDLRFVDWNAVARTGELILKVLEDDDRRTITLLLDTSASMTCGDPPRLRGALRLAAILGGLALARLDGVVVVAGAGTAHRLSGLASLPRLYERLGQVAIETVAPRLLVETALRQRGQGRLIWIGDFAEPEQYAAALTWIARRHLRLFGLLPELAEDQAPRANGWLRLRDLERDADAVMEIDAPLREAFVAEMRRLRLEQERLFTDRGYTLVRFPVPAEGDFRLGAWMTSAWTSRV
jgi:uncharacterized protein (DUF58 family)